MILLGIDEAGYGPTLGPLVVAATAFRLPDDAPRPVPRRGSAPDAPAPAPDLWRLCRRSTCRKPDGHRIPVNDSKALYSAQKGLQHLEEGGLSFLHLLDGAIPEDFRALVKRLRGLGSGDGYLELYPWYRGENLPLPTTTFRNHVEKGAARLGRDLAANGIELVGIRAMPIEVLEFNERLDRLRNKARVSFLAVGSLLARVWRSFPGERIEALVDRQGGRMYYAPLLYRKLRPRGLRIEVETEELSVYEVLRDDGPGMRVSFAVGCECQSFPVALSSMFCKYLRELHMALFNRFFCARVASLRGTAGYHVDAERFLADIACARRELGIDDAALIRRR
jgi:hypothetical protein